MTYPSLTFQKQKIRDEMQHLRSMLPPDECVRAAKHILKAVQNKLCPLFAKERDLCIALYASDKGEPDFLPFVPELIQSGAMCCFPVVDGENLVFYSIAEIADLGPGAFGIHEPLKKENRILGEHIDLALIPGLAYDALGRRLGRGRGFYDRYLQQINPQMRPIAVGTAYDFQIIDCVPTDACDVNMDYVVAPQNIISLFSEK